MSCLACNSVVGYKGMNIVLLTLTLSAAALAKTSNDLDTNGSKDKLFRITATAGNGMTCGAYTYSIYNRMPDKSHFEVNGNNNQCVVNLF